MPHYGSMERDKNILCVCTAGQQRSPTCARILRDAGYDAHSAGIHPYASPQVSRSMVDQADVIIALNEETDGHASFLRDHFNLDDTRLVVLDIPDIYPREDPELISTLEKCLSREGFL